MKGILRSFAGPVLLVTALVALAVLGGLGGIAGSDQLWPPVYLVDRIAVVGPDAQIRTFRPDGSEASLISSGDGFFTWPTWAPNGRDIVFSGIVQNAEDQPVITLFNYQRDEGVARPIYEGEAGFAGLLAEGVVHYPLWSPDSSKLAFVAVTRSSGLALFLVRVDASSVPEFVLDRGPLWMSWSTDSSRLAVHRSLDHFLVGLDDQVSVQRIRLDSDSYRVPAWRPNLHELTLATSFGGVEHGLYSAPTTAQGLVLSAPVARVGPNSAFLWSPNGSNLAVADDARPIRYRNAPIFVYRQLRILDSTDFAEEVRVQDNVLAYFWSPDGAKIAMAVVADASGGLRWKVIDVATGETTDLVDFIPSPDQLTMFQFFDQYAYSHQLWSPDSRFLVFAGRLSAEASSAGFMAQPTRNSSRVFIIDTGPVRTVDELADGVLGFWSPI